MKKRDAGIEYLKVLSMMMIVLFHYFWNSKLDWANFTYGQRIFIDIFYMFGELGVNCFALISGYYMSFSKKPARLSKVKDLWVQIFTYSVISAIAINYFVAPISHSTESVLGIFMPVTHNIWWYATAYFILYIFSPYINKTLNNTDKDEYKRLVLILIAVFSVIPTILGIFEKTTESFLYYNRFIWLVVLYVIAGYIRIYGFDFKKLSAYSEGALWLSVHLVCWAVIILNIVIFEKWPDFLGEKILLDAIYFWRPNTIVMLILSVSLFMIFKNSKIKSCGFVSYLSKMTFAIYMIHGGRSGKFWWNRIFHNAELEGTWYVFVEALIAMAVIFAAGTVIETIRQKLTGLITKSFKSAKKENAKN